MAIIAVDYDDVLHNPDAQKPGMRMGLPVEGAIEAMQGMKIKGHELIVFTVRGDRPKHVIDWLRYYNIPFDDVTRIKPDASLFIDDKALTFRGWEKLESPWR